MLVPGREILDAADKGGYAVGAFNVHTIEMLAPVLEVAEEKKSPVLLQFSYGSLTFIGAEAISVLVTHAARQAKVPVVIHLDHGDGFAQIMQGLRHGFTSVMIDASKLPLTENIALTRQVVEAAHAVGVSVEAEIGRVGGTEEHVTVNEWEASLSDPAEAEELVAKTGIDSLAPAFGTAHGFYKGEPKLDLERLAEVNRRVSVPLVMHGGSGVPDHMVREAIKRGVAKVNVATELKDAWARALRDVLAAKPNEIDPRKLLAPAREAVKAIVRTKIDMVGSAGRA
ncbi:MAG: class II fructose-1,6-bisphosphate aldolase [Bacillota bacterium]